VRSVQFFRDLRDTLPDNLIINEIQCLVETKLITSTLVLVKKKEQLLFHVCQENAFGEGWKFKGHSHEKVVEITPLNHR
jgi:hypothetical protein